MNTIETRPLNKIQKYFICIYSTLNVRQACLDHMIFTFSSEGEKNVGDFGELIF